MSDQFRVLVVDDEFWIRQNLQNILDWEAHSFIFLEPAEDGEQALERIHSQHPDIVITDVNMPFLSGTDLIKTVCEENPSIVFIALSGYGDYEYVRSALVAGAIDYLLKPITKASLLTTLNKAVERISHDRLQTQEKQTTMEKLRIATGTAIDREISQFIHKTTDTEVQEQIRGRLAEYELDFAGFTMIVFHTAMLTKIVREQKTFSLDQLILEIKQQISILSESGKFLVFHYIFRTNEFILLTDMNRSKLEHRCRLLLGSLFELTGFPVTAVFSKHYIAFSDLRNAYNETVATLLSQPYCTKETILFPDNFDNHNVVKRITTEQEKQLLFSVVNGNRSLFQHILFEEVCLFQCAQQQWSYAEVRQTVDRISWLLRDINSIDSNQLLVLDNLAELLLAAVDGFDIEEMQTILEQMLDEVFDAFSEKKQSEGIHQTVMRVKEFIDQNYFDNLWLTGLSQTFSIESSYLSKTFKHVVGENIMLYISKVRVEKAKNLLCENKLNITDIASMVGYDDYSYFSRVFRKITGISPREYKEKQNHV
jgi:YesN/AraC family two-component response regulator